MTAATPDEVPKPTVTRKRPSTASSSRPSTGRQSGPPPMRSTCSVLCSLPAAHLHRGAGIICEQDVAVKLRDGVTIYTDIYRPEGETNIPVIICWGPFGKRPGDAPANGSSWGSPGNGFQNGQVRISRPGVLVQTRLRDRQRRSKRHWSLRRGHHLSVPRTAGTATTSSNGLRPSTGVTAKSPCSQFGRRHGHMAHRRGAAAPPHLYRPVEGTGDLYRESHFVGGIYGSFGEGFSLPSSGTSTSTTTRPWPRSIPS